MSDVVALVLFLIAIHVVLLIYWKGMGSARKKKYERLSQTMSRSSKESNESQSSEKS